MFLANEAPGQQVRDFVPDDHTRPSPCRFRRRATTVSFHRHRAVFGAMTTSDGKTPGVFQIAHTKARPFSARALAKARSHEHQRALEHRTYVFELRESAEPCYR